MTLSCCVECGEPCTGAHCDDHAVKVPAHLRGYDYRWAQLSRRARREQPFCTDCGSTENLQLDHLPSAWERKAKGLRIRLGTDAETVCGPCNLKRGAARGTNTRGRGPSSGRSQPPARQNLRLTPDGSRVRGDQRRLRGSSP